MTSILLAVKQLGLNIGRKNTKTIQLSETPVELENEDLEDQFAYLGSIMSKSNATVYFQDFLYLFCTYRIYQKLIT